MFTNNNNNKITNNNSNRLLNQKQKLMIKIYKNK